MNPENFRIYIPSRGRAAGGILRTVAGLPECVHNRIVIVCPVDELAAYMIANPLISCFPQPDAVTTIGAKRDWILHWKSLTDRVDYVWMMDDDLKFKVCHLNKFVRPKGGEESNLLHKHFWLRGVYDIHQKYDAFGLGTSFMAPKGGIKEDYHLGFAFGMSQVAIDGLRQGPPFFDVFEDLEYTLQLLTKGYRIGVSYDVVVDQYKADAPGGVTGERTLATIDENMERLVALYPDIVQRKDRRERAHPAAITRVSWKRAAKVGETLRLERQLKENI